MEAQALIMSTARSMENMDRKEDHTKKAIKYIEDQLKNPTNELGTDTEKYLQVLAESSILDKYGYNGRSVMAIASVMQDFV